MTKDEFNYRLDDIERRMGHMITRNDWDKHMTLMDELMTEMRAGREERIFYQNQWLRADDRIRVLEQVV